MPILDYLGFSYLLLAILVFPLVVLVTSYNWRLAESRNEEVRHMLSLASEETYTAEFEPSAFYNAVTYPQPSLCAACYAIASNRCSRCKEVHYCSGKCQVIHWRQGHKDVCFPPESNNKKHSESDVFKAHKLDQDATCNAREKNSGNLAGAEISSEVPKADSGITTYVKLTQPTEARESSVAKREIDFSSAFTHPTSRVSLSDISEHTGDTTIFSSKNALPTSGISQSVVSERSTDTRILSDKGTLPTAVVSQSDVSEGSIDTRVLPNKRASDANPGVFGYSLSRNGHCGQCLKAEGRRSYFSSAKNSDVFYGGSYSSPCTGSMEIRSRPTAVSQRQFSVRDERSRSTGNSRKVDGTYTASSTATIAPSSISSTVTGGLRTSVGKAVEHIKPSKVPKHQKSSNISKVTQKCHNKGLFPYELFVKLYNWKSLEFRPAGLKNCGNSCYANVVLQSLTFTPPLTSYLLQGLHSKVCAEKAWCFTCELEKLVLQAKNTESPPSPAGIMSHLGRLGSNFCNGREEDAHEFLRYVVEAMQRVCVKEVGRDAVGPLAEETSLIGLTFGGYLCSEVKCMKCDSRTERRERMLDLSLEIGGDIKTVDEALQKFTATEVLDGDNKYECTSCRSYEIAKKKLTIAEAPNVLTIALKRFEKGGFGKINKPVRFAEELDLTPSMSHANKSNLYSLYGVVVHLDVGRAAFSGHYICYMENSQNKWFQIDDSTVRQVGRERVLTKDAYMLFYARCSPQAPEVLRSSVRGDYLHPFDPDSLSENGSIFSDEGSCNSKSASTDESPSPSPYYFGIHAKSRGGPDIRRFDNRRVVDLVADPKMLGNGNVCDVGRRAGNSWKSDGSLLRKPPRLVHTLYF